MVWQYLDVIRLIELPRLIVKKKEAPGRARIEARQQRRSNKGTGARVAS
jgi:hypothetical protein